MMLCFSTTTQYNAMGKTEVKLGGDQGWKKMCGSWELVGAANVYMYA